MKLLYSALSSICLFISITAAASQKVVGAKSVISSNELIEDSVLQSAAKDAVRFIEMSSTIDNHLVLSRFLGGTKQVVSGVKYELQLEIVPTDCPRGHVESSVKCNLFEGAQVVYDVDVWYKSWTTPSLQSCKIKRYRELGSSEWTIQFNDEKIEDTNENIE